jgi:hypothetical protein
MKKLELLQKVQRVEAPAFLLTRIEAKIRAAATERLPVSWQWAGVISCAVLIFLNVMVLKPGRTRSLVRMEQLAQSMDIQTSNQLYDE